MQLSDNEELLIKARLENAIEAQTIADVTMHELEIDAPIIPIPLYKHREEKRKFRIYDKINRLKIESPKLTNEDAINLIDDLAGGRFLVHYISDVKILHDYICTELKKRDGIELVGECRDCIFKARESGFRALTQDSSFKISPDFWFPFEIQIMTYLGHDWDQKQHVLYENRFDVPKTMHSVFSELSVKLFEADQTFDRMRTMVGKFNKDTNHN